MFLLLAIIVSLVLLLSAGTDETRLWKRAACMHGFRRGAYQLPTHWHVEEQY